MIQELVDKADDIKQKIKEGYYSDGHQSYLDVDFDELKAGLLQIKCMMQQKFGTKEIKDGNSKTPN